MAIKLIALYKTPKDTQAFLAHYNDVHKPLVDRIPHLQKIVVSRITGSPMGHSPYFLIAEMHFADIGRFEEAMASPENRAAGKDLMGFAGDIVTMMVAQEE